MAQQKIIDDDFEPDDFEPDGPKPEGLEPGSYTTQYKIGDEVGKDEPLKFESGLKVNLDSFKPKTQEKLKLVEPINNRSSMSDEDVKLARETVPYKGGIASALYAKNHPVAGVGRTDERLINTDILQGYLQKFTDKIALNNVIPDIVKPALIADITMKGHVGLSLLEFLNDPTAPVFGLVGAMKKALGLKNVTPEVEKHLETIANEIKLEVQPQKVGTPQYNTSQFGLHPTDEALPYPLSVTPNRLRPPSTNATVFDALLPERLKYNEQGAAQRLTTEVVPPRIVEPELREPITFNGKTLEEINELPSGQPPVREQGRFTSQGLRIEDPVPIQPGTYGSHHVVEEPNQSIISSFFEDDATGMASGRPRRTGKIDVSTLDNPIAKIIVKLRQARPLTKDQAEIYRIERGKRLGNISESGGTLASRSQEARSALQGSYGKVRFDPLELSEDDGVYLLDAIDKSGLDKFQRQRAIFAIDKIMNGTVPQRNEIRTLSSVFTNKLTRDLNDPIAAQDITAQLVDSLYKKKPVIARTFGGIQDLQRTIMSSSDMSAPFRQGGAGILNKEWWTSWDDMFKAWGSEKAAKAIDDSIRMHPEFKLMEDSGLHLTDVSHGVQEEGFGSAWAENNLPFIKRSERAYSAFLNKFRSDLFSKMMSDARKSGDFVSDELAGKYVADIINTITGRASLGKAEKYVDALNEVFYAPRLMGSRVKMLEMMTPTYYIRQPSYVRKQALKSVLSMASLVGTVNGLGYMAGGSVEPDLRSADAGKVKFGNTRIDPGTGELQYLTLLARRLSRSVKNQKGEIKPFGPGKYDPNSYDLLLRFLENKAAPGASLFIKGVKEVDPEGKEYNMPAELAKTYIPMIASDLMDIFQDDDDLMPEMPKDKRALAAGPLTFFGMGSQTYK